MNEPEKAVSESSNEYEAQVSEATSFDVSVLSKGKAYGG